MRQLRVLTGFLLMGLTATMAQASGNTPYAFKCQATGEKMLATGLSTQQVCALFKTEIQKASQVTLQDKPITGGINWIKVNVAIQKNGIVSAQISQSTAGKVRSWPSTSLAVSDSAISSKHVATLAQSAAVSMNRK